MQYTRLGRTGLQVSRLCLGTMNFGPHTAEADSFQVMDRALELGINFWDTADVYGWKKGARITETILGNFFAQGGGRREKAVVATKVYGDMGEWPNERRLSKLRIKRGCEDSLKALQTDYIDLYQMHHIDRHCPWEECWEAMEQLVREGKVLYIGSSNFAGWHIAQAQAAAAPRNFLGLVSEQSLYNLNARHVELEVIPACEHYGLGLIPWSPLAGGLLGGVLDAPREGRRAGIKLEGASLRKIQQWERLCARLGEKPADVALAWLLHQKVVTAPIIGPRNLAQLDGALRALEIRLSDATLKKLDAIFPPVGKGGPAPEAYAW